MSKVMQDLEKALQDTFDSVRDGDLSHLGLLAERLETGLSTLPGEPEPERTERILILARRNETCLAAARRGIISARQRLVELKEVEAGTLTYTDQGERRRIETKTSSLKQRI
ncbi:MAG: hypothetical protein ACK5M4_10620 [Pseudorhodobacter sp.]